MAMTRKAAESLFTQLREHLTNTEKVIIRIIETEAWSVLGYDSFAAAWNERMKGVSLATQAIKAHVVYALLDTANVEDVIGMVSVAPEVVQNLKRQKGIGVPPQLATVVRRHTRSLPSAPSTIRITVTATEYQAWSKAAERRGVTLTAEVEALVRAHYTRRRMDRAS